MSVDFKNSETKKNLMKAFAGESMARNRYTLAAEEARKQSCHVLDAVFTFTANQEKEHAEIFFDYLREYSEDNVNIEAGYPVDISKALLDLLKNARHNEYEEFDPMPELRKATAYALAALDEAAEVDFNEFSPIPAKVLGLVRGFHIPARNISTLPVLASARAVFTVCSLLSALHGPAMISGLLLSIFSIMLRV